MENYIFWSEIGSGFEEPGGTHPTKNSQEYPPLRGKMPNNCSAARENEVFSLVGSYNSMQEITTHSLLSAVIVLCKKLLKMYLCSPAVYMYHGENSLKILVETCRDGHQKAKLPGSYMQSTVTLHR